MKDTKLISKSLSLITTSGNITARKLRNDQCVIRSASGGHVCIGSYLESGELLIQGGNVTVGKRLGIVKSGLIEIGGYGKF